MNKKQYLSKLVDIKQDSRFINFYCDFETVVSSEQHYVTCYSIVSKNYKLSNVIKIKAVKELDNNSNLLLLEFLDNCFNLVKNNKNKRNIFFFHNLNRFDSYFLLNSLSNSNLFDIKLISRNNQVYKIIVLHKKLKLRLQFRDSLLYLPISLGDITSVFCTKYKKLAFSQEYNIVENYINNDSFKNHLQKYCLNDALSLEEGFEKFLTYIRTTLHIEPLNSLSLPGISLRYFRSQFYDYEKLPIERLSFNKDNFIRKSYRGGTVDLFKPHLLEGFHYDVNSLYPYIMKSFPMPVGLGEWVTISDIENFFGFVKVEVTSPNYEHKPFLNYYDEKLGLISPLGTWTEVYFSEEIKHALTLGYKFKYIKGLSYKKGIVFNEFVDSLYQIRLQHRKGTPLNLITKLLLNSLYGRFGMKTEMLKSKIIDNYDIKNYVSIYDVINISTFTHKSLINFREKPSLEKLNLLLQNNYINIDKYNILTKEVSHINESSAVQIASAITAYGRIFMDKYKRDSQLNVYYSDTDSIFCKNPMPSALVSDVELGKFKLENKISEAIFLLPKVYMLKTYDNKTIIKCKGLTNELLTEADIYSVFLNASDLIKKFVSYFKRSFNTFTIKKQQYNFKITTNLLKRDKVMKDGKWVDTNPLRLNNKI